MSDNNNLLIGAGLVIGAIYLSRRRPISQSYPPGRGPLGTGSMPGNVGTGVAQVVGGLLGNLLSPKPGGGTANGVPPSNSGYDWFPVMVGDSILQNNVGAADPGMSYDPTATEPNFDPSEGLNSGFEGYA